MSKVNEGNLDYCLKCSTCHTQCPVLANDLSFPGPKQMGPELERLRLARGEKEPLEIDERLTYCTNCKRCDMACPHGVKPSYYNLKNKARLKKNFRDWVLAHNGWWSKISSMIPGLANFTLKNPLTKWGMGLIGIANRDFPLYKKADFKLNKVIRDKKVLYFPGCYASFNEPEIGQATIDILEACGYQVELAPLDCCGTPIISNGLLDEAEKLAQKNAEVLLKYIDKGYKIVTSCSSCGLTLKEEYQYIFPGAQTDKLKENVWDLFELLAEEKEVPLTGEAKINKAYYHVPCHLKAQGIGTPASKFLSKYAVKELIVEDSYCCGISGTYGFKKEKYELSMKIGKPLFEDIKDSNPDLVITDCGTCKLQIEHATAAKTKHPVLVIRDYLKK